MLFFVLLSVFGRAASSCVDNDTVDCAVLNSLIDICNLADQAKKLCPNYCNVCDVLDGNWSPWSFWSDCDVTCEIGSQIRTRSCSNPAPQKGGIDCSGHATDVKSCFIQSGWTDWYEWSPCSTSCGIGMQSRERICTDAVPNIFELNCIGNSREVQLCYPGACTDGSWSDWQTWSKCIGEQCGTGIRQRSRTCSNPKPSPLGNFCLGNSIEISSCETTCQPCLSNPCHSGNCSTNGDNFECLCSAGYSGQFCQNDVNECDSNPCSNGATCVNGENMYTCRCERGWTGTNCDKALSIDGTQLGTRFVTGFVHAGLSNHKPVPQLLIVSSVSSTTNVNVTIPYLGMSDERYELHDFLLLNYSTRLVISSTNNITSNGVEVTSDQPIALFTLIESQSVVGEGTLELPTSVLGQLYIVETSGATKNGFSDILVVAIQNLTIVKFALPSGTTFTITLNNLETYRRVATATESLAGTIISASKQVVVHAGHPCTNIPANADYCDVLLENVPAEVNLGSKFVVPYLIPRTMYSVGGAAPHNNTFVKIYDGNTGKQLEAFTLNEGDSFIRNYAEKHIILIETTKKMLLSQYSHGVRAGLPRIGDPSLLYVPAITQFGNDFHFVVPDGYVDGRVSIVLDVTSYSYDPLGFKLNGSPPQYDAEVQHVTVSSIGSFYVCYINVSSVSVKYELTHTHPDARFGAMLYAYNKEKVFLTALGFNFYKET